MAAGRLFLASWILLLLPLLGVAFLLPSAFPSSSVTAPTAAAASVTAAGAGSSSSSSSSSTALYASASSRDEYLRSALIGVTAAAAAAAPKGAFADDGQEEEEEAEKPKTVEGYLTEIDKLNLRCPEFPKALEWVNAPPLSLQRELRGKLVLLDFWTYCCINCMHVLPNLAKLEEKYKGQPFVVVGVHSAKFENEKDSANIREAIQRYRIQHPVVNDRDMDMFGAVGVQSWPSLVLVSPKGTLISIWPGERNEERVDQFIAASLKYYGNQGLLNRTPLQLTKPTTDTSPKGLANSPLSYPGKVHVDPSGAPRVFVADTGHHRILVVDKNDGSVIAAYGSPAGEPGFEDGGPANARFSSPQGLCASRDGRRLYVCDTDNHAVRMVDLESGTVATLVGNGEQGFDYSGGQAKKEQYLSSPWDVVLDPRGEALLVAMAGTHQIWRVELPGGKAVCYSGTGREAETNAGNRLEAAWAQPSGLAVSGGDGAVLYVADSESSTVREMALTGAGKTRTLVGGAKGQSLFAFGDKDGSGAGAKLQHPLAVAALGDGRVLVADSYNHKLKVVDPTSNTVRTLVGSGKAGLRDGIRGAAALWEPGGLAVDPEDPMKVWVADTNNNALRVVDVRGGGAVTTFVVTEKKGAQGDEEQQQQPVSAARSIVNRRRARVVDLGALGGGGTVQLEVSLPAGVEFTATRPSKWQLLPGGKRGGLTKDGAGEKGSASVKVDEMGGVVELESAVYFCEEQQGVCRSDGVVFKLQITSGGPSSVVALHMVELSAGKKGAASGLAGAAGGLP